jgi:predicted nucleotidyltransferase component of viral defense system
MTPPSRATPAGRAYLDIQKRARADRRPVDEYLQFYVLECFLARLSCSRFAERYVLKGGALLAAFGERRPTRDIDFLAQGQTSDPDAVLAAVNEIASIDIDDGVAFDLTTAKATLIRDEDIHPGVRVTMSTRLWTARTQFHIDVNVGDPVHPPPNAIEVPRLLGGELTVLGYPLAMVFAEKIVTAVARGTLSTRWRDFADIYLLARRHRMDGGQLVRSIREVAAHRGTELAPLGEVLDDYGRIGQGQWSAWLRRQQMVGRLPDQFNDVVAAVTTFADPAITGTSAGRQWLPATAEWTAPLVGEPTAVQSKHGTVRANRF